MRKRVPTADFDFGHTSQDSDVVSVLSRRHLHKHLLRPEVELTQEVHHSDQVESVVMEICKKTYWAKWTLDIIV